MTELLQLKEISYQIERKAILHAVSLCVRAGECLGLIGPNGAGKTTLIRLMAGLLTPNQGQIWLKGQALSSLTRREIARQIGYVPQRFDLQADFSVAEVILNGRNPHLNRFQVEQLHDRLIAEEAMRLTDLTGLAHRSVLTLSGGERQRVVIARALTQQPGLLVLDEPTASLDLKHQHEILKLCRRVALEQGLGVVVSLHDLSLAARYCDRLAVLSKGHLVALDQPSQTLTRELLAQVFEVEALVTTSNWPDETRPDLQITVVNTLSPPRHYARQ